MPQIGDARASIQQMVGFIGEGADAETVTGKSRRRYAQLGTGLICARADELIDHFGRLESQGAQRFYVWFSDPSPETIAEFAETVISR